MHLFMSCLNYHIPDYFAWKPDPSTRPIDAFTEDWSAVFYAFMQFNLVGRVLQKIEQEHVMGIIVLPYWSTQSFPNVLLFVLINLIYFSVGTTPIRWPAKEPGCRRHWFLQHRQPGNLAQENSYRYLSKLNAYCHERDASSYNWNIRFYVSPFSPRFELQCCADINKCNYNQFYCPTDQATR